MKLIDGDKLCDMLRSEATPMTEYGKGIHDGFAFAIAQIETMPDIEAETVRRGRWIVHTTWQGMFGLIHSECSECKFDRNGDLSSWKLCPNCGAKMDGGVKNGFD